MKTLSGGHIRSFSKIFAVFLAITLLATTQIQVALAADGYVLTTEDMDIVNSEKKLREQSKNIEVPVSKYQDIGRQQAEQAFSEMKNAQPGLFQSQEKTPEKWQTIFFVSFSLGHDDLMDVLDTAASTPDSLVVFRGIRDEKNFAKSVTEIQQLAAKMNPMPNIALDPTLFRDYRVSKVPTIISFDKDMTQEVARVSGVIDPSWLAAKIKAGKTGDLGVRGDVEEILERDLIDVMKEKIAAINWDQKKEDAKNNYWNKQQFIELPAATKPRTRAIDPSVTITQDINDADGKTIIPAGTTMNPLRIKKFQQAVVVFDPLDKEQVKLVDLKLAELKKKYARVTLIVTHFDRQDGWKSYESITDHFDAPVFKLTPDVHSTFQLEFTPSIITANDDHFIIEELSANGAKP